MAKKQAREERICLILPQHCSSLMEVRTGAQTGRELEAGTDADARERHYLLVCSVCFLIESRTTNPGMAAPIMG